MDPRANSDTAFKRELVRGVLMGWAVGALAVFLLALAFGASALIALSVGVVVGLIVGGGLGFLYAGRSAGQRHG